MSKVPLARKAGPAGPRVRNQAISPIAPAHPWLSRAKEIALGTRFPKVIGGADGVLFGTVMALIVFGVVMVYSASSVRAVRVYGDGHHFLIRQAIYAAIGIPIVIALARLDYHRLRGMGLVAAAGLRHAAAGRGDGSRPQRRRRGALDPGRSDQHPAGRGHQGRADLVALRVAGQQGREDPQLSGGLFAARDRGRPPDRAMHDAARLRQQRGADAADLRPAVRGRCEDRLHARRRGAGLAARVLRARAIDELPLAAHRGLHRSVQVPHAAAAIRSWSRGSALVPVV